MSASGGPVGVEPRFVIRIPVSAVERPPLFEQADGGCRITVTLPRHGQNGATTNGSRTN